MEDWKEKLGEVFKGLTESEIGEIYIQLSSKYYGGEVDVSTKHE